MKKAVLYPAFATLMLLVCSADTAKKVKIFIAGDSTAQTNRPSRTLQRGWGQYLPEFLNDGIEVENRAIGGRSTSSYIREGRWDRLMEEVSHGDWVFIQFGHNDTSTNEARHTPAEDYKNNLVMFCNEVKDKGAHPVIITSIVFRTFDEEGKLISKRPNFTEYVQLSCEAAAEADVPLIDMNRLTHDFVEQLGPEVSKEYYFWVEAGSHPNITEDKQDDTHLQEKGARSFAALLAGSVKDNIPELALYLK